MPLFCEGRPGTSMNTTSTFVRNRPFFVCQVYLASRILINDIQTKTREDRSVFSVEMSLTRHSLHRTAAGSLRHTKVKRIRKEW